MKNKYDILDLKKIISTSALSGKELAVKCNINPVYLSQIVTGKNLPSIETLLVIAKTLNVDIRDLFKPTLDISDDPIEVMKQVRDLLDQSIEKMK